MKKLIVSAAAFLFFVASAQSAFAQCTKIKDGGLFDSAGHPIALGFDQYGYNYQAHMFNGLYDNFSRPVSPATEAAVNLSMKWSDEWLSNVDCNNDTKLDRGLDVKVALTSDGISKGWLTNHMEGDCTNALTSEIEHYTYFTKIVYVGAADPAITDQWAGKRIWGVYAIIEEVSNNAPADGDPGVCGGTKGGDRSKLVAPAGFGVYVK